MVCGDIQLQFTLADPSNPSASTREILDKLTAMGAGSPGTDLDDGSDAANLGLGLDGEDEEDDDLDTSDETEGLSKTEVTEKRKKKLRLKRLKRKTKARAYEFTGGSDVTGIAFLEISRITDLPPERNGEYFFQ